MTGLAGVVGDGGPMRAMLLGHHPRPVEVSPDVEPSVAVVAEIRRTGLE